MGRIIYQKTYPAVDMEEQQEEEFDEELEKELEAAKDLSYEEIKKKLTEGMVCVPLPEREKSSSAFVREAVRLSEEMEIDTVIRQFQNHISVSYTFPCGAGYGFLRSILEYADDISFFMKRDDDNITMSVDHYTHAVFRHGIRFHP